MLAACGDDDGGRAASNDVLDSEPDAGNQVEPNADLEDRLEDAGIGSEDAGIEPEPTDVGQPIWDDTATRIVVESWEFWSGARRFDATPELLTQEQTALLRAVVVAPAEQSELCPTENDLINHHITIERPGATESYDANRDHVPCTAARAVDFESFAPFEATIDCQTGIGRSSMGPIEPSAVCEHGVYTGSEPAVIDLPIHVEQAGEHRIGALQCGESRKIQLTVVAGDGDVLGSAGGGEQDPSCVELQISLEPGEYTLRIDKTGSGGGDFFLRFEPVAG